ncbi:ATP-binding cassette domain-containing protein [Streptomyces sp. NPDC008139]|uniref:ATP-binding cassette domain-containing protein n=1 Tax=Streptomyces sp. NPDC008139 TaxID=3364814 RepID=UPI0036E5404D
MRDTTREEGQGTSQVPDIPGIRLDGVGRRYGLGGPWVLRDVTLDLPRGGLVRIEGANGTGKTTLLRLLAGVDRPSAGRISGRPATATAYVPERFPAALPFPVLRYLTHLGAVRGLPRDQARDRARHWLDRFGITGYARTPLDELSKGTCQKVAVVQALLADPELLVLDEAWTGLDHESRTLLDTASRERAAAGATVVFVDHDPRRLADAPTLVLRVTPEEVTTVRRAPQPWASGPGYRKPVVHIEATGAGEVPSVPGELSRNGAGAVRIAVPQEESDAALRALLDADPPWHVASVRTEATAATPEPVAPADVVVPRPRRAVVGALLRYQADLLLRSHRWLPPLLFYGAVMAIGVAGGEPLLGSLGYEAALLLPFAAWMVRVCVTNEPGAARACVASAVGAGRAQVGSLGTALGASALVGTVGTGVVVAVSGAHSDDFRTSVAVGPAAVAGLLAAAVSVLAGCAVGAVTNPPLVRGGGWSVLCTVLAAGALLVASGSPANAAVAGLVTGSRTGAVRYPLLPLAVAAVLAAAAAGLSCRFVSRLGDTR